MRFRCRRTDGGPCFCVRDRLSQTQTVQQRQQQISEVVAKLARDIAQGRVKVLLKNGKLAFEGWNDRQGVGEESALFMIQHSDNVQAKMAIARVSPQSNANRQTIAQ